MITSLTNEQVKRAYKLQEKKYRDQWRLFLIEGRHLLNEALQSRFPLQKVFYCPEKAGGEGDQKLLAEIKALNIEIVEISRQVLEKIAFTETPQDWLAVAEIPRYEPGENRRAVVFDRLQDPGNIGTIMRTGVAFDVCDYYFLPGTADPYASKAVRASQGAIFKACLYMPTHWEDLFARMNKLAIPIWAADKRGDFTPEEVDWGKGFVLVFGREGGGLAPEILQAVNKVRIPHGASTESLNVAVAAGILLYASSKTILR